MVKTQKNEFQVRLSDCGNNRGNWNHGKMTDTNALMLIRKACIHMAKDMVGEDNLNYLLFGLGLRILKDVHKKFDEIPESEKLDKIIEDFEITQPEDK